MLGSAKGMWQKCTGAQVRARLGQHRAEEGEVVVLHQHRAPSRGPVDHGVGDGLVVGR